MRVLHINGKTSHGRSRAGALALADRIGKRAVTYDPRETGWYGRVVAVCRADAEDLNAWMVRQGQAIAYRRYAEDYVNTEMTSKALRHGIWAGTFQDPSDWRREKRAGGGLWVRTGSPSEARHAKILV